jgi:HAE1 family hydrophobic/amphiphilic exporter-1
MELVSRSIVILAVLFLLLIVSLRQVRLTAVVMASIVFAIVISLSLFYFFGLTVNFITISGLTVCFGLILDNSILVLDAIHRRLEALSRARDSGFSRRAMMRVAFRTIVDGADEVLFPILSTTLTTMVAFLSFIFLSGRLALYYVPLAIAVATAMAASIFVAFIWIPVVLNQSWARHVVRNLPDGPRDDVTEAEVGAAVRDDPKLHARPVFVERFFSGIQRLWWIILPATTALIVWSGHVYDTKVIKGGFFRMPNAEELTLYLELPSGTDIAVTSEIALGFEESLMPIPEGATMRMQVFGGNRAYMRIEFDEELKATEIPLKYRAILVDRADGTGGASIFIGGFSDQPYFKGPFRGSALNSLVAISGYNSKRLNELAETALARIQRERRARNARITTGERFSRSFLDESVIALDRDRLAQYGLTVADAAAILRRLLGVDQPWLMVLDGSQEQVQLSFAGSDELQYAEIAATLVNTPSGERVRIGDLGTIDQRPLSGPITRQNQKYTANLNWEYVGTDRMRRDYIEKVLAGLDLPYGFSAEESERTFFTQEEEEELTLTLVLAIVFIYFILAGLFESASLPFMVLLSLPLALVGVVLIFWQTNTEFDSSARIGLVLLFGIVVNNAILLVSRFRNEAQLILEDHGLTREGDGELGLTDLVRLEKNERATLLRRAIARGTRIRLRSILLTSGTTVVGLAPLLLPLHEYLPFLPQPESASEGADIWDNLALSSIGGLISSTVLLIFGLPVLMYFIVRFWWIFGRVVRPVLRAVGALLVTVVMGAAAVSVVRPETTWLEPARTWLVDHKGGVFVNAVDQLLALTTPHIGDPRILATVAITAAALALLTWLPVTSTAASAVLALSLLVPIMLEVGSLSSPHPTMIALVVVLVGIAYTKRGTPASPGAPPSGA